MKQPNSLDPIAWARYNEWLSGSRKVVRPAKQSRVPRHAAVHGVTSNLRVIDPEIYVPPLDFIRDVLETIE